MTNKEYADVMNSLGFHNSWAVHNSWNGNMEFYADEFKNEQYGFYYVQFGIASTREDKIQFLKELADEYVREA